MIATTFEDFVRLSQEAIEDISDVHIQTTTSRQGYRWIDVMDSDGDEVLTIAQEVKSTYGNTPKVHGIANTKSRLKELIDIALNSSVYYEQKHGQD